MALPVAGGLVSAVFLFSALMPTFAVQSGVVGAIEADVPTVLATEASMQSSLSFGLTDDDIVVDVLIDEQGRLIDYSFPQPQTFAHSAEVRRSVANTLVCTKFTPATLFGQPAAARIRITLRADRVDVRG
jgi:hypothetical protein